MSKNELVLFLYRNLSLKISRAVSKIRSYDDFVPYYHQFIEQMANLLGNFLFNLKTRNNNQDFSLFRSLQR